MYRYNDFDKQMVTERVEQFRLQTKRYLAGKLSDDEFKTLRLMNGLYLQTHAPMLRVAIPYGLLSSGQLRKLAHIARKFDKGFGHFTTRQNIQYNWPKLEEVPDILAELAEVEMHAIQTSGNCIRNVTSDHLAGVAPDETDDPRIYCELIRQWSSFHPEFSFLPRKFKIAVSGAEYDRAATQLHDIGLHMRRDDAGEIGFQVLVGGGLGRTPVIGKTVREFLPQKHLYSYLHAIMRIYNEQGRRDNKYKARIKILVNALGINKFRNLVEDEWRRMLADDSKLELTEEDVQRVRSFFASPPYRAEAALAETSKSPEASKASKASETDERGDAAYLAWFRNNTAAHKVAGYRAVYLSLKHPQAVPGDLNADQMDAVADLADAYSFGELRVTHTQNLVFADVEKRHLTELYAKLEKLNLATPNIGGLTDVICCPGLDYCSLANAGTIEIADRINRLFDDMDYIHDLGDLRVNMSGCMNACGHHHVAAIGILGVEKKGVEWYQIQLGGNASNAAALGKVLGPSVPKERVADMIGEILEVFKEKREGEETFLDTFGRIGIEPFKQKVYHTNSAAL